MANKVMFVKLRGCLYSAVEVHLKKEGQPVCDELLQLKRRLEKVKGVWMAGKRKEEEEKGRVKGVTGDVREFWEVMESAKVAGDLMEIDRQVEEMVCKLE